MTAYVAPARFVLTGLHEPDPSIPPVTAGPDPSGGATKCGLQMLASELWREVERQESDRVCAECAGTGAVITEDGLW